MRNCAILAITLLFFLQSSGTRLNKLDEYFIARKTISPKEESYHRDILKKSSLIQHTGAQDDSNNEDYVIEAEESNDEEIITPKIESDQVNNALVQENVQETEEKLENEIVNEEPKIEEQQPLTAIADINDTILAQETVENPVIVQEDNSIRAHLKKGVSRVLENQDFGNYPYLMILQKNLKGNRKSTRNLFKTLRHN